MNSKRKTMLVAAFVVAVVALAGVGYAAAGGYTAKTTTANNNIADSQYLLISLNSSGDNHAYATLNKQFAFDTETKYVTENNASSLKLEYGACKEISGSTATSQSYTASITAPTSGTDYDINTTSAEVSGATYKAFQVKSITVTVDFTKASTASGATLTTKILGTVTNTHDDIKLFIGEAGTNKVIVMPATNGTITKEIPKGTSTSATVTYDIYLGVAKNAVAFPTSTTALGSCVLDNFNMEFSAEATVSTS